jgi:hypothetical protein
LDPVPALDVQFWHWAPHAGTGNIKLLVFMPVPARGALYWHGDDLGTSASQLQHRAKNRSQFQHWAGANIRANIYNHSQTIKVSGYVYQQMHIYNKITAYLIMSPSYLTLRYTSSHVMLKSLQSISHCRKNLKKHFNA